VLEESFRRLANANPLSRLGHDNYTPHSQQPKAKDMKNTNDNDITTLLHDYYNSQSNVIEIYSSRS